MKKQTIKAATESEYVAAVFRLATLKGLRAIKAVGTVDCRFMLMNGKGYTSILTVWIKV